MLPFIFLPVVSNGRTMPHNSANKPYNDKPYQRYLIQNGILKARRLRWLTNLPEPRKL
ncbi:hypothetical protein PCAR4_830140 [Paraburkholderia caribensis]|nr:hypothetical protein PCAR4_830140 [Paraburkholderia caribensis]